MTQDQNLLTVYGLLERAVSARGEHEAIYDLKNRVSYQQLKEDTDHLAGVLAAHGITQGDRLAIALPNWYETAVLFCAAAKIGAIVVPFNPSYKTHEIAYILKNAEPKALFITEKFTQSIPTKEALLMVPNIISVRFQQEPFLFFEDWMRTAASSVNEVPIQVENDLFCILYTSGTTGVPKGVMVTHRSIVQSANTIASAVRCTSKDVFLIAAPLFHIFGMVCNLFCGISAGSRMVLKEKYHPREMLELIEQEKVTIQQGVPTMFLKELEVKEFDKYDLSTLRAGVVGAAPIPSDKIKEIRGKMGINLCQSYGISETASVTMTPYEDEEEKIASTLGKPIEGVELKIVDEYRTELAAGKTGEIAIKSFGNMKGYYKMPEQTNKVLDHDGWFYTGDLGVVDGEGYLHFVGRQKELIIRGGYNIYPQEIESALMKHPAVAEAAVVGLPDAVLGEIVCSVIQLKSGHECKEEEMQHYLKEKMATYKIPEKVIFTTDFPVTASGKIQKLKLRDQIMEKTSDLAL